MRRLSELVVFAVGLVLLTVLAVVKARGRVL